MTERTAQSQHAGQEGQGSPQGSGARGMPGPPPPLHLLEQPVGQRCSEVQAPRGPTLCTHRAAGGQPGQRAGPRQAGPLPHGTEALWPPREGTENSGTVGSLAGGVDGRAQPPVMQQEAQQQHWLHT